MYCSGIECTISLPKSVSIVKLLRWLLGLISLFHVALLLFDNLAYTKYVLHRRYSDEEYVKHHKSTKIAGCIVFWGMKNEKHG